MRKSTEILILIKFDVSTVECAHLRTSGFMKPSPYVELTIDGNSPRRTEIVKNTSQPKWNENFTVLVTLHSKLHFNVLDHNSFRKDTTIGEKKLDLYQLLSYYKGKCENMELTIDLTYEGKQSDSPTKSGELICVLSGLQVEMPSQNNHSATTLPLTESDNDSTPTSVRCVLNGVRVKVRSQGSENVVPPVSQRRSNTGTVERPSPLSTSQSSINIPYGM